MKEFLLAMTILRALRTLRDSDGVDFNPLALVDSLSPQLVDFFGKDVTREDLDLIKLAFTDLLSLLRE
jgi:hypothetical protein